MNCPVCNSQAAEDITPEFFDSEGMTPMAGRIPLIDLAGQRFGLWTVLCRGKRKTERGGAFWCGGRGGRAEDGRGIVPHCIYMRFL